MTEMKSFYSDLLFWVVVCLAIMALWWTWRLGSGYVDKKGTTACAESTASWGNCKPGQSLDTTSGQLICRCPKTALSASLSHPTAPEPPGLGR